MGVVVAGRRTAVGRVTKTIRDMKWDHIVAPFNLALPLPSAFFKEKKGIGEWGQPRKEQNKASKSMLWTLRDTSQIWRSAEAFAKVSSCLA